MGALDAQTQPRPHARRAAVNGSVMNPDAAR